MLAGMKRSSPRKSTFIACIAVAVHAFFCVAALAAETPWRVGIATRVITPELPVPLVGYGGREKPFDSVDTDIYVKALALEDETGQRAVLISGDLVGFQAIFFEASCERIMRETGLTRGQIMLNASHNHTGPLMSLDPDPLGNVAYAPFTPEMSAENVVTYTRQLQERVVEVALEALDRMAPAALAWGADRVEFPMNRRVVSPEGPVWMRPNPQGPTDRRVPVLAVSDAAGELRAVVLGCACHNTGLTADHNVISGDYAGYAQEYLEEKTGATVLFLSGCGADANPEPRTDIPGVRKHGRALSQAVQRVLDGTMQPVRGPLKTGIVQVDLPLLRLSKAELEPYAARKTTENLMAKHMIGVLESGKALPDHYTAPVAVWAFGTDLTLVGLPSEVVADYALTLYRDLPEMPLWVSAYANDFFGYVPTAQIVREGGHETIGVTTYLWGRGLETQAGFFSEDVEKVLLDATKGLIAEVSAR
jgi:neutral ceramidase